MRFPFLRAFAHDLAIDLGTVNTVVYAREQGIVINEPSVVALAVRDGVSKVHAIGADARLMMGRTPENIHTVRPLRDGVIADIDVAEQMIKHFIDKAHGGTRRIARHPKIVVCVPSGSTQVERRAIRQAATSAGASAVYLIEEPMAAAIGAGIPVNDPMGTMVVDIGGGTTEIAVLSLGGLAFSTSVRVGGDKMDDAIASAIRRRHNLWIGEVSAERLKMTIGAAVAHDRPGPTAMVRGRDLVAGVPREIEVTQAEVADALSESISRIVEAVRMSLEQVEPEIAADLCDHGIVLTGGGALLGAMDDVLSVATGLPVTIAAEPLTCVALGAGKALESPSLRGVLSES